MRLGRLLTIAIGCLVLMPAAALAQSSIAGNVTDDTGGVLPRGQAPKHGLGRRLGQFVDIDVEQGGSHECQRHAGS